MLKTILPNIRKVQRFKWQFSAVILTLAMLIVVTGVFLPSTIHAFQQPTGTTTLDFADEAIGILPNATWRTSMQTNYTQNFATLLGETIIPLAMAIGALLLLMLLLWGGIEWISSGGEKGKLEKARGRMTSAIIGIIVLSATIAIFGLMQQILGICVINFGPLTCG